MPSSNSFSLHGTLLLLFLGFSTLYSSYAQLRFLKFVPSSHYTHSFHRIELINEGDVPINLGGYLLVTRDYLLRFPNSLTLTPKTILLITSGTNIPEHRPNVRLLTFQQAEDFITRKRNLSKQGNYLSLFNPAKQMIAGFYFSPSFYTAFLPDTALYISPTGKVIPYYIPVETDKRWEYLSAPEDPAIGFVNIAGHWQYTSANPHINILDIVRFKSASAFYSSNLVTLQFDLDANPSLLSHILIYKGKDPEHLTKYDSLPIQSSGKYRYLDIEVNKQQRYYYRIGVEDLFGYETYSPLIQVFTGHERVLTLQTLPTEITARKQFYLLIESKKEGEITLDLFTENYEYLKPLYIGYIEAGLPLMLALTLEKGEYCVLLTQNKVRHFHCFEVK